MTMLIANRLTKCYPGFSLYVESLEIHPDDVVGLIGPNGAGKTTLIRTLLGIVPRDSGEISYLGRKVGADSPELRAKVGYVPEEPVVYEKPSVRSLIQFVKSFYSCWDEELYRDLLKRFSLDPGKPVRALSKGMRTKLLLLMALSHRPDILFLDEPTSGLDPISKDQFWLLLEQQFDSYPIKAVIISSHQLDDIESICNRIVFLLNGRVVFDERKEVIFHTWKKLTFLSENSFEEMPIPGIIARVSKNDAQTLFLSECEERTTQRLREGGAREIQVSAVSVKELFRALTDRGTKLGLRN